VRDYVAKGSLLYLEGKLETSSWDDKESGKKMYKTQVVIRRINFLSPRPAGESHGAAADQADYAEQAVDDSSIPF
jgi:single-strand DNA-binding protein